MSVEDFTSKLSSLQLTGLKNSNKHLFSGRDELGLYFYKLV